MKNIKPSLAFCLLMDAIGLMTYSIPFLGELGDIFWAPISGIVFFLTFGGAKGAMGAIFNFAEELFPGLDFIPTFTIMYFLQRKRSVAKQEPGGFMKRIGRIRSALPWLPARTR
jgi:hypothetical protein